MTPHCDMAPTLCQHESKSSRLNQKKRLHLQPVRARTLYDLALSHPRPTLFRRHGGEIVEGNWIASRSVDEPWSSSRPRKCWAIHGDDDFAVHAVGNARPPFVKRHVRTLERVNLIFLARACAVDHHFRQFPLSSPRPCGLPRTPPFTQFVLQFVILVFKNVARISEPVCVEPCERFVLFV